jgi:hypothetical protein
MLLFFLCVDIGSIVLLHPTPALPVNPSSAAITEKSTFRRNMRSIGAGVSVEKLPILQYCFYNCVFCNKSEMPV